MNGLEDDMRRSGDKNVPMFAPKRWWYVLVVFAALSLPVVAILDISHRVSRGGVLEASSSIVGVCVALAILAFLLGMWIRYWRPLRRSLRSVLEAAGDSVIIGVRIPRISANERIDFSGGKKTFSRGTFGGNAMTRRGDSGNSAPRRLPGLKQWLAVVFAVAVLSTVSGCDFRNNHQGPVALSVADGQLEIAVCSSMRAEGLSAYYEEGRGGWIEFLHTNGQAELTPETVVSVTTIDSVFGNHTIAKELDLSSTTRLSIVVYGSDSPNITAAFDLKLDDLDDGVWQHPDGTISSEPCP